MRKTTLLKTVLLLCAFMVGGSAWAQTADVTYDFTGSDWSVSNGTLTNGTVSFTGEGGANFKMNTGYFMMGKSGAYINFPTYTSAVEKIVVTGNSGASAYTKMNIFVGETAVSTETTGSTGTNTYEIASGSQAAGTTYTLKVTSSHNAQITKIEIFYAASTPSNTWTVTYNGNGATSGDVPTDATEYSATNSTVTVLGNTGSLAKTGYTFAGWNTSADGTGTGYVAGDTFTITANTTLFAQWTVNTYNVTLPAADTYGSYTMDASNPVAYGTEVTLTYTPASGYDNYEATWSVNGTAISGKKFTMPDEAVTVTVSVEKVLAMTIDFESEESAYSDWTFNTIFPNYKNTDVDAHGGSKYGSTGGRASGFIKTNEKVTPASLTCYVSKQTTNNSTSTWYVQVSSDGSTWTEAGSRSATDMGKGEWKEFTVDLSKYSNVYVRVYYSGSTAVRLIDDLTLVLQDDVVSTEPSIVVDPATVNVDAGEHDGTLGLTYENLTISDMTDFDIQYYDAEGEEVSEPDWIEVLVAGQDPQDGDGYVVSYFMVENEDAARTAYFKVYALDDELNEVYSDLITITQAAPVVSTTYTLANAIVSGKHYIITNESYDAAMGYDRGNNRDAVGIEINDGTASVLSDAGVYEFVIYGPDADGRYSIYDEVTSGYLYAASSSSNYLKTKATLDDNGKWSIVIDATTGEATIKAMGTSTHNLMGYNYNNGNDMFSCYQVSNPQAPVYLYEKNGETTPTESRTLNEFGYATYCSQNALDFTDAEGVTAWAITDVNGENITFSQITGKVPAGTGMLLKGAANASVTMTSATGATALSSNLLIGTLAPLTINANEYFGLSGDTFVPVLAGTVPAGKALLPVSAAPESSRLTFVFEDASGIASIENGMLTNDRYYNLSGQRVDSPKKGLYIVNGKKVVVK